MNSGLVTKMKDKFFLKQWNIGLSHDTFGDILKRGALKEDFHWLPIQENTRFFADPFICHAPDQKLQIIYEDYRYEELYGKISMMTLDKSFNILSSKFLLDTHSHLSYPYIWKDNGSVYVMPENSKDGEFAFYELNQQQEKLEKKTTLFPDLPLLDSTILKYQDKYWLFATQRGVDSNNKLYIYHSENWNGPYSSHRKNPVKNSLYGSRPAGAFIQYNGEIYRPTQNCSSYYGKSVIINKITHLSEDEFSEEPVLELHPPKNSAYNFAIHTINFSDDVIVIDGLRRIFAPVEQVKMFLRKSTRVTVGANLALNQLFFEDSVLPFATCL